MKNTIEKIINFAVQICEPDEIILFGSMANGTNNIHSDLDLLIVLDEGFPNRQFTTQIRQFAQELSLRADVLIYSRSELKEACSIPHSFVLGVCQSGKIVYQKGNASIKS